MPSIINVSVSQPKLNKSCIIDENLYKENFLFLHNNQTETNNLNHKDEQQNYCFNK